MRKLSPVVAISMAVMMQPVVASASTWKYALMGNSDALFFFDADTVVKSGDLVEVWFKTVRTTEPYSDELWSVAARWRYDCKEGTSQNLAFSNYKNDGSFIKSGISQKKAEKVVPGSIGAEALKIVCKASFPNDTSGKEYQTLFDNDVFKARDRYNAARRSQTDSAPK